jgi:hypothetical protein
MVRTFDYPVNLLLGENKDKQFLSVFCIAFGCADGDHLFADS